MDSGVHVWSTPFGYCEDGDEESSACIKDEEEVAGEFPDTADTSGGDPPDPACDPLRIDYSAEAVSGAADSPGPVEPPWQPQDDAPLTDAPASVVSGPDLSSAESLDSQEPAVKMWFKAEPDTELTAPTPAAPAPARPSGTQALTAPLIDPDTGRELVTCNICRSSFKQKVHLQNHYRTVHPGYRPYSCDICGNRYHKESFVRLHRKLHTGEKDYECRACGKAFVNQARLTAHLKTARFCPASSNRDVTAMERMLNDESDLPWSERRKIEISRKRSEGVRKRHRRRHPEVIDVPDSP